MTTTRLRADRDSPLVPWTTVVRFHPRALTKPIAERLTASLGGHMTARRDLERYYALLDGEAARLVFTEPEAAFLTEALAGQTSEAAMSYAQVWVLASDAVHREHLDRQYRIDGPELVARIRGLSPGATLALLDCVERALLAIQQGLPLADALRRVGLVHDRAAAVAGRR